MGLFVPLPGTPATTVIPVCDATILWLDATSCGFTWPNNLLLINDGVDIIVY